MAGQSAQEKEAKKSRDAINADRNYIEGELKGVNTDAGNLFKDYRYMYTPEQLLANMDEQARAAITQVNAQTENDIAAGSQGTAERMAAGGIKGGLAESTLAGLRTQANKGRVATIGNINQGLIGQKSGIMQGFNQMDLNRTGMQQNANENNVGRLLQKYGMVTGALQNNTAQKIQNSGNFSDSTWLDDTLAVANTASQFVNPFGNAAPSGGSSLNIPNAPADRQPIKLKW